MIETMLNSMKTAPVSWGKVVAFALLCVLAPCYGQGTFTWITFDGPPLVPRGTAKVVQEYYESGMSFAPIDPNAPFAGFVRRGGAPLAPRKMAPPICRLPWQAVSSLLR